MVLNGDEIKSSGRDAESEESCVVSMKSLKKKESIHVMVLAYVDGQIVLVPSMVGKT